jgi:hypothetical protein
MENIADITIVDPENRDIFREIFLKDDSEEEFLGFDPEDLEKILT